MKEHEWIESRGKRLSAMIHTPQRTEISPVVIVCHGFTGEKVGGSQYYCASHPHLRRLALP